MDFNNTKIQDINNIIGLAWHGDMKIVYKKDNNFICCGDLIRQLRDGQTVHMVQFFRMKSTVAILGTTNFSLSGFQEYMSKKDLKQNTNLYTGHYISPRLFPLFISWLCPQKFLQYSDLLNLILHNASLQKQNDLNVLLEEQNQKIQSLTQQLQRSEQKKQALEPLAVNTASEQLRIFQTVDDRNIPCLYVQRVQNDNKRNPNGQLLRTYNLTPNSVNVFKLIRNENRFQVMANHVYMTQERLFNLIDEKIEQAKQHEENNQ